MNTVQYSGFGTSEEPENNDPMARLRFLAQEYKAEVKHKKTRKGGFLPLVPIATAAAGALAAKITSELYDFLKGKLIREAYYSRAFMLAPLT